MNNYLFSRKGPIMAPKVKAEKKVTAPRRTRNAAAKKVTAEKVEHAAPMKAFHQADAIARQLYPLKSWVAVKEVKQMRTAIITAMNLFNFGYVKTKNMLGDLVKDQLASVAVKHTMGQLDEESLLKETQDVFAVVDALGMPLTPRAAFVYGQQDVINRIRSARQSYAPHGHPLTMADVQQYYYVTFFASSPVAYFLADTDKALDAAKALIATSGASQFLEFADRDVVLHEATLPEVQGNLVWMHCVNAIAALDHVLEQYAEDAVADKALVAVFDKFESLPYEQAALQLIEYVAKAIEPKAA